MRTSLSGWRGGCLRDIVVEGEGQKDIRECCRLIYILVTPTGPRTINGDQRSQIESRVSVFYRNSRVPSWSSLVYSRI